MNQIIQYVPSAGQMKQYDQNTIEKLGIPGMVLMERAAMAVADEVCRYASKEGLEKSGRIPRVLAVCGCGNNGGDGFAAARLLSERGMEVDCVLIGQEEKCSPQTKEQIRILRNLYRKIHRNFQNREYDIIIDALFGIGLTREVQGEYARAIEQINASKAYKVSVDIPSGVETDSGRVMGCAVQADKTVTFGFLKRGLCLYPGRSLAGKIVLADIGISESSFLGEKPEAFTCTCPAGKLLPPRNPQGHKGTFGKLLIVAGSLNMAGAAILCAKAAYRMGAGMVKLVTVEGNRQIIQESLPEALLLTYTEASVQDTEWKQRWQESLHWADACVIGCGCGQSNMLALLLKDMLQQTGKPVVLDADALNLISREPSFAEMLTGLCAECILTPHLLELSRLLQTPAEELKSDLYHSVAKAVQKYGNPVIGKEAATIVGLPDGRMYLNRSGNSGMATAGSGDVLAGLLGGLLAQGEKPCGAAWKGVYLHGLLGDVAAAQKGEYAVMASDLIEALGDIGNQGGFS